VDPSEEINPRFLIYRLVFDVLGVKVHQKVWNTLHWSSNARNYNEPERNRMFGTLQHPDKLEKRSRKGK